MGYNGHHWDNYIVIVGLNGIATIVMIVMIVKIVIIVKLMIINHCHNR